MTEPMLPTPQVPGSGSRVGLARPQIDEFPIALPSSCAFGSGSIMMFPLSMGTGSSFVVSHLKDFYQYCSAIAIAPGHEPFVNPAAMVASIRSTLSLNMSETAAVLHVERPTVYAWLRGDTIPKQDNVERLRLIYELASWWADRRRDTVGPAIRQPKSGGTSILDLLQAAEPDGTDVKDALREFHLATRGSSSDDTSLTPAAFARSRGWRVDHAEEDWRVSAATGQRLGPDDQ